MEQKTTLDKKCGMCSFFSTKYGSCTNPTVTMGAHSDVFVTKDNQACPHFSATVDSEGTLPGAWILFKSADSTGNHENAYGNGSMDISLYRPTAEVKWVDLLDIRYSSPTPDQLQDMETAPPYSEGNKEHSHFKRRLSKKQASYLQKKISEFLMKEFKGIIPADDEIDALIQQSR